MPDPNLNALWCRAIAEELKRAGVKHVVLCPGSRNSPLLHALNAQFGDASLSHIDERSAGFIALGLARASDERVAICVTSGSALANLLPAVVEADAAELPLIIISADRPWKLIDCDAPQAMAQRGIFDEFMRTSLSLGKPTATPATLRALRSQVSRLAQYLNEPVHLNVPLRDPLPPLPDPAWTTPDLQMDALNGRADGEAYTVLHQPWTHREPILNTEWIRPELKGVIVAGCGTGCELGLSPAIARLAERTGFPLIADAPSALRQPGIDHLVCTADALVNGPLGQERADLIIQIGPTPLARSVYEWLGRHDCPWIVCEEGRNLDFLARAWIALRGRIDAHLDDLAQRCTPSDATWSARWRDAEAAARRRLNEAMTVEPWGEVLAAHRAVNHVGFSFVHLASSMSVRHGNLHLLPAPERRPVFSNRGVNGIDGTLGTFLGELEAIRAPGLLLIGDLACLHDLPALALTPQPWRRGAIVVLNNDGGGIFDFLAVAKMPQYRELVRTPHGRNFDGIARQFGLAYTLVENDVRLRAALDAAAQGWELHLIECRVTGGDAVARHRALIQALATAT
ncbi:MAG TPA: 2-succinyl-5-enolpyruvyl-6-hydroxy-3-cyclohexene-1-carboxylic-acid synthase [Planctomycetota bacterium]|nr:2-succinyl-5-enolpyruvyl-6-hydroxy-3-cyclohexene-1-carboxylic-acid synthase [Planctomycetota bacterium]